MTPFIQVFLFLASFGLEIALNPASGKALRALCATWIAIENWKVHRRPAAKGKLAFWIWIGVWLLLAGLWIQASVPSLGVHAAHLVFIMGFGLMIFMVASRVTLAHGGYPLDCESNSRIYSIVAISLVLSAFTRFTAIMTSNYVHHLGYAALLFTFAALAWGFYFLPKILRPYVEK